MTLVHQHVICVRGVVGCCESVAAGLHSGVIGAGALHVCITGSGCAGVVALWTCVSAMSISWHKCHEVSCWWWCGVAGGVCAVLSQLASK